MEDQQKQGRKSAFFSAITPYSSSDPSMNVPVTAGQAGMISPYMNFNPAFINQSDESEYLLPEGSTGTRGRLDLACTQIGGAVLTGGFIGGANGIYSGIIEANAKALVGKPRNTHMLNAIGKRTAVIGQAFGTVALMYSGVGFLISKAEIEGEANTLLSGAVTGLLYKSSAGTVKCLRGGGVGLLVAAGVCLWNNRYRILP